MRDDLSDWIPADTESVSIADPWDLDYWTRYFQVNGNRLRRAIACVGTRRVDLLANLCSRPPIPRPFEFDVAGAKAVESHAGPQLGAQASSYAERHARR